MLVEELGRKIVHLECSKREGGKHRQVELESIQIRDIKSHCLIAWHFTKLPERCLLVFVLISHPIYVALGLAREDNKGKAFPPLEGSIIHSDYNRFSRMCSRPFEPATLGYSRTA